MITQMLHKLFAPYDTLILTEMCHSLPPVSVLNQMNHFHIFINIIDIHYNIIFPSMCMRL
jgi:hypothetical protein